MQSQESFDPNTRRPAVARTAWLLGAIAVGVYVAFLVSAVLKA